MTDAYTPTPEHHFTFGLWTVGNPGRDPFGHEVRPPLDPVETVERLAELGAYGVNFHDDDLVPPGSSPAEREAIVKRFRARARRDRHEGADGDDQPVLAARCSRRARSPPTTREVRRFARRARPSTPSTSGVELGAEVYVMWGGREGVEADAAKDVRARARPLQGGRRPLLRVHPRAGATTCASPSSPSPTSRAATSSSRPSATRSRSSASSSGPTWSASTPSSPTRRCRASSFHHARRADAVARASCSTSTSTASASASTTRTSASAPRASATRSTW